MNGLDTNVLVAWLLGAPEAAGIQKHAPLRVNNIVLAELVWVFDRIYDHGRREIAAIISRLLETQELRFEDPAVVARALEDYTSGRADFADYLLMREGESAGCRTTYTLDRGASRHPGFTLLRGD